MTFTLRSICPLLQVFDMPTSLRFYREALGFEVASTDARGKGDDCDWALLKRDGAMLMLNTAYEAHERPAAPAPQRAEAHRDTILYFDCPDLDAAYEHLGAAGYAVDPPQVAHYGMEQLYLDDPDGYGICLQRPT